jgi:transcriptional regulator with XRE-family HTH domain
MDTDSDSATLAYIRHVLGTLSISPTALAQKAGISPTTLTRPLNNSNYKFNLSATTIEKISKASGINAGPFFNNKDFASVALASIHDQDAYDKEVWNIDNTRIDAIVSIGAAGLGLWQEVGKNNDFLGVVFLRHVAYASSDCFAVIMLDGHAGDVAYLQDELICVRFSAYKQELVPGQHVLLERRREGGRLIELTVRRLQKAKAGWQLNTPGRGRLFQDQVVITDLPGDNDAQVIGVVEYAVRRA